MSGLVCTQPTGGGPVELRVEGGTGVKFLDPFQITSTTAASVIAAEASYVRLYHNSGTNQICFKNSANVEFCLNETGPQGAQGAQGDDGAQGPQGAQGPIGPQGSVSAVSDFVYAYATTTQGIASGSTFQNVTFNVNGTISGWTHTAGSADFTCPTTGTYLVSFRVAITFAALLSLTTVTGSARVTNNGTEVPGSQSSVQFPVQALSSATALCLGTQQMALTAGDVVRVQGACNDAGAEIAANGIGTAPVSAALSIIRLT